MHTFPALRTTLCAGLACLALVATGCGSSSNAAAAGTDAAGDSGAGGDAAGSDTGAEDMAGMDMVGMDMAGADMAGGGDSAAGDASGGGDTGGGGDTASAVKFGAIYPKMATTCAISGCHTAKDAKFSGKLDLSTEAGAHTALVGDGATTTFDSVCTDLPRVKAGKHAESSLWIRLNPDAMVDCAGKAPKMPSNGTAYTKAELDAVAAWIDGGAQK